MRGTIREIFLKEEEGGIDIRSVLTPQSAVRVVPKKDIDNVGIMYITFTTFILLLCTHLIAA